MLTQHDRAAALELLDTQPAEGLRATAALIRETARAATPGPWEPSPVNEAVIAPERDIGDGAGDYGRWYGGWPVCESISEADRAHVLAWQPRTALAVADWLHNTAATWVVDGRVDNISSALDVARAWLTPDGGA